jgi:hypothetical protein
MIFCNVERVQWPLHVRPCLAYRNAFAFLFSPCMQMIFCNVEGVQWLDDVRLVISSDKAKKDQPFRCVDHEQRISIFALPEGATTPEPSHVTNTVSNKASDEASGNILQLQQMLSEDVGESGDDADVEAGEDMLVQSFFDEDGAEQELVAAA